MQLQAQAKPFDPHLAFCQAATAAAERKQFISGE